jgi:hypothetical protein
MKTKRNAKSNAPQTQADEEREQARRALQMSMDTRQ